MNIEPVGNMLIIEPVETEKQGELLTVKKNEEIVKATIAAMSEGFLTQSGYFYTEDFNFNKNDTIFYRRGDAFEVEVDGTKYTALRFESVMGRVNEQE